MKSFKEITIATFVDIERIKKPSKFVYMAGKMICQLVDIFRGRSSSDNFSEWKSIQNYVGNGNLNKFT